jgi:hypothetical protein
MWRTVTCSTCTTMASIGTSWSRIRFDQYQADKNAVGDAALWMKEEDICMVTLYNGAPLAVTPPNHVVMEVMETDPGLRGDTATGGTKPATLATGAVVRVPLFMNVGDLIKIDTRTGEYLGRSQGIICNATRKTGFCRFFCFSPKD